MNIARILYPVRVLGPGKRVGIWTAGCSHHCPGCSNPELWSTQDRYEISIETFRRILDSQLADQVIDGFVLTGGDPFFQADGLASLLELLQNYADDILVYTGYTYPELLASEDPAVAECLQRISVLIDGRYIERYNDGALLRGSSNQNIIFLDESKRQSYDAYLEEMGHNQIQNFASSDGIISVGIHQPGFQTKIDCYYSKEV